MLFSDAYQINRARDDDWFDPVLLVDTKLFVDPFLIFHDQDPFWAGAHHEIIAHFDRVFGLLAEAGCRTDHLKYDRALAMLHFPEPPAFCLGYTARGTRGSGSGAGHARSTARAMCDAIGRGLVSLDHFEALGILNKGIGPDLVSDTTCTILKPLFIEYTQRIAQRHGIPLAKHRVIAAGFDPRRAARPMTQTHELPTNPVTGGPVILTPARFLRDLPVLTGEDWFYSSEAADVRNELSDDVLSNVDKDTIVREARRHEGTVRSWIGRLELDTPQPYDLVRDPKGVYQWAPATSEHARQNPLTFDVPTNEDEFAAIIETILDQFQHFIEQRRGWALLWDGSDEKPEEAAQLVFLGLAYAHCAAHDINLDREVELGRGPVDFKFSRGFQMKALLEVKKLTSGSFWNGLEAQLPSYLGSDGVQVGWYLGIRMRDGGVTADRVEELPKRVAAAEARFGIRLRFRVVDARPKRSASKIKPDDL